MGMAASQARHLALVARKSNCEYEGQQINQARTVLSNQSANLFNQMLGLQVPVPPSTQDFTKAQYSYTDGLNESTIDSWQQLANDPDYNYVVTHHYYTDVYTGSQKKLSDPQVQFSGGTAASVAEIENALRLMTTTKAAYEEAKAATKAKKDQAATLSNYSNNSTYTYIASSTYSTENNSYEVTQKIQDTYQGYNVFTDKNGTKFYQGDDGNYYSTDGNNTPYAGDIKDLSPSMNTNKTSTFVGYNKLDPAVQQQVKDALQKLVENGALSKDLSKDTDLADVYFDSATGAIAFQSDLRNLNGSASGGTKTMLPVYITGDAATAGTIENAATNYNKEIQALEAAEFAAQQAYEAAETAYNSLQRPTYIGNSELTLLTDLTDDQKAELKQIVKDMQAQGIDADINNCFDADGNYLGGIYSFQLNGVTYYTTFNELNNCYQNGTGNNNIDGQPKLAYYNATYVSTKVEETEKALLETDGNGRFTSVRFENDSVTYTLNMETITDDEAYQDAMNQYYYESAKYDKMIQDINAKTSIIQQQDLQLELRLKQLDTEQNALTNEIEAVSKVVKDNVEKSFKTFGG